MNTVEEKEMAQTMRSGFTLIEILVAVAIIGIMGTVAVTSVMGHIEGSKKTAAQESVNNIKMAVTTYYTSTKKWPSSLQDLTRTTKSDEEPLLQESMLEDPWGTEYKMERSGSRVRIISAGPDTSFGTEDDIDTDGKKL